MKILNGKKLARQFREMPAEVRSRLKRVLAKHTESAASLARRLVPVASGELKGWIHTKYESDGMTGSVEAAPRPAEAQKKAFAVEFGRTYGSRGATEAQPYMRKAQSVEGPKFKRAVKTAVRSGMKAATNG